MSAVAVEPRDRPFDPSKFPRGQAARELVATFRSQVEAGEDRARVRRADDQKRFEESTAALILDLAHCALREPEGWLYVSLGKEDYAPEARQAPFLTEAFPALVRDLGRRGALEIQKGFQGAVVPGRLTTIRPGAALAETIAASGIQLGDIGRAAELLGDPIVLRSPKVKGRSRDLPVPDSEDVTRLREEMDRVNAWLAGADLEWQPMDDEERDPDTGHRFMRRIFNGSFDKGGRLYGGFWQGMSKQCRLSSLLIDGELPVSLDYGQIGVRAAYALAGIAPPEGDLYAIPGLDGCREGVKALLSALLAADGLPKQFPKGIRPAFPRMWSFTQVLSLVEAHHGGIRHLFGTGLAHTQQLLESRMLLTCLTRLMELGSHALPIHDCLLVPRSEEARVTRLMEWAAEEVLGLTVPVEASRSDYYLQPSSAARREGGMDGGCSVQEMGRQSLTTSTVDPVALHKRGA